MLFQITQSIWRIKLFDWISWLMSNRIRKQGAVWIRCWPKAGKFNEFENKYATQQQLQKYNEDRQMFSSGLAYMQVAIPTTVFVNVFAMIVVFVLKERTKIVGITLIIIGIISIITISAFGIIELFLQSEIPFFLFSESVFANLFFYYLIEGFSIL